MVNSPLKRLSSDPLARLRRIHAANACAAPPSELRVATTRVFQSADGAILLDWMIEQSFGLVVPQDAPESALREVEARKRFVRQITGLVIEDKVND
jgi:hypothetical protein